MMMNEGVCTLSPLTIRDVLSDAECKAWIADAEGGDAMSEGEGEGATHSNDYNKIGGLYNTIEDEDQATVLFSKIATFISHDTMITLVPGWVMTGINENFRILKYLEGEDFHIHVDPDYSRPFGHPKYGDVSFLTLVIYLNDNFVGGHTQFYDCGKALVTSELDQVTVVGHGSPDLLASDSPENILIDICPIAGTALLFGHNLRHAGGRVLSGVKYVLRTDVMFTKSGNTVVQING